MAEFYVGVVLEPEPKLELENPDKGSTGKPFKVIHLIHLNVSYRIVSPWLVSFASVSSHPAFRKRLKPTPNPPVSRSDILTLVAMIRSTYYKLETQLSFHGGEPPTPPASLRSKSII